MIKIQPSHVGMLHKELGVPQGKKISIGALMRAKSGGSSKMKKQANFAINARGWSH